MAEIDTRPLESVRSALTHFQQRTDHHTRFSPDRNLQEIENLTKELARCRLQLEVKENEKMQANLKLETLRNVMQELSGEYENRIAHLEADERMIARQQPEASEECRALRDELTVVKDELDAVKSSNALLLREIELMETTMVLERENTKDALSHILRLNEYVLASAVAAIRAEEERSVFFQEIALELFNSDKNREVIERQLEMVESLESELVAKTVEIAYLQSELQQVKEHCVSSEAAAALASETMARNQEQQATEAARGNADAEAVIAGGGGGLVTLVSREDGGEQLYTKEIENDQQAAGLDGYVLVAKSNADAEEELKGKLDAAQAEIGHLRFSLEEAVRRAELAEKAKAALERALKEDIQKKAQRPRSQLPKTPSRAPAPLAGLRSSPGGGLDGRPLPGGCLTLGKVLNMKYK
ncbi:cingulin-like protein 1 [Oryza brachyantha]|uniref:cingulin-like protein 1 n=1 Tax=Oryza brachyantha TaxID=4533 RepID=UPI001ADA282F|nr:cingulin-like protein 1 [Oryza brachyantha]